MHGISRVKTVLEERMCETCGESRNRVRFGVAPFVFDRNERCRCDREREERVLNEQYTSALERAQAAVDAASYVPRKYASASLDSLPAELSPAMRWQVFSALRAVLDALPDIPQIVADRHRDYPSVCADIVTHRVLSSGVALIGDYGTGKTYAMAALLNAARAKLIAGRMVSVTDFMAELRASYSGDRSESEQRILDRYRRVPLLVIDDLDKLHATDWSASTLYHLINARYVEGRPVFMTSNFDANRLLTKTFADDASNNGRAIVERLVEMNRWIEVRGKSLRRPQGAA